MSKQRLIEPYNNLEQELIETLEAGLKEWRPDLNGPESYSDWQGCVRGLIRMFEVKRRPLPLKLEYHCFDCHNEKEIKYRIDPIKEPNTFHTQPCHCQDRKHQ